MNFTKKEVSYLTSTSISNSISLLRTLTIVSPTSIALIIPFSTVTIFGSILVYSNFISLALLGTKPRFKLYVSPGLKYIWLSLLLIDNNGTGITVKGDNGITAIFSVSPEKYNEVKIDDWYPNVAKALKWGKWNEVWNLANHSVYCGNSYDNSDNHEDVGEVGSLSLLFFLDVKHLK